MMIDAAVEELVTLTHAIAGSQDVSGAIRPDRLASEPVADLVARASVLAQALARRLGKDDLAEAIASCVDAWARTGFAGPPDFGKVRAVLAPPGDGENFFFWGPLRLANGAGRSGWLFECFISQREEPRTPAYLSMYDLYPHPKNICQSAKLIAGTDGLMRGNNIVFFPENICASEQVFSQKYAIFFFNKFKKIFESITIKNWDDVGDPSMLTHGRTLTSDAFYEARCVWGYLHDYFHYQGKRPFDTNIGIKTRWYTGLIEELKVDLQVLRECCTAPIPHSGAVREFILFDRMFRYPSEADWFRNFDSGTGLVLLEHLHREGAIRISNGRFSFSWSDILASCATFIDLAEAVEATDDEAYLRNTRLFIDDFLPSNAQANARFGMPRAVAGTLFERHVGSGPILTFSKHDLNVEPSGLRGLQ